MALKEALLNFEWVKSAALSGRGGGLAQFRGADQLARLTLAANCGWTLSPCKGGPLAPACGGFGLDNGVTSSFAAHHEING